MFSVKIIIHFFFIFIIGQKYSKLLVLKDDFKLNVTIIQFFEKLMSTFKGILSKFKKLEKIKT